MLINFRKVRNCIGWRLFTGSNVSFNSVKNACLQSIRPFRHSGHYIVCTCYETNFHYLVISSLPGAKEQLTTMHKHERPHFHVLWAKNSLTIFSVSACAETSYTVILCGYQVIPSTITSSAPQGRIDHSNIEILCFTLNFSTIQHHLSHLVNSSH